VCHESRVETLRHYKPLFGFAGRPGRVYFDPECDVLHFGACPEAGLMGAYAQFKTVLHLSERGDLARVRRVAVDEAVLGLLNVSAPFSGYSSEHELFVTRLESVLEILRLAKSHLPGLRELMFVSDSVKRRFYPQFPLVQASKSERIQNRALLGAVDIAVEEMSMRFPAWIPPAFDVVSRKALELPLCSCPCCLLIDWDKTEDPLNAADMYNEPVLGHFSEYDLEMEDRMES
jgi:hypothetical protein